MTLIPNVENINKWPLPLVSELKEILYSYLKEARKNRLENVIDQRSRYMSVCLEDVFHERNKGAVLRTCEAIGIQQAFIIENPSGQRITHEISRGSDKWLDVKTYEKNEGSTEHCLKDIRNGGWKIVVADPNKGSYTPANLPIDQPFCLCFGAEKVGITEKLRKEADYFLRLPMHGFVESFNVSVAVAIATYQLMERIKTTCSWGLPDEEKERLRLQWAIKSVPNGDSILHYWLKNRSNAR